jgi:dihydroxyacid dehydratase/phosphogluconate dehydratase
MNAVTALDKQIERYRQMTGEQRLGVALDLHEMSCDIARAGIRRQHPDADADEIERLLRQRIELERDIKPTRGVLAKYAAHVTSASLGAVTDKDLKF